MKVLFIYKFCTLGGVETVLRARVEHLAAHGVEAHCFFFADYGGRALFADRPDRMHLGTPQEAVAFAVAGRFDVVSTIDTEEVLPLFAGRPAAPPLVLEAHSAYLENLSYLDDLPSNVVRRVLVPSRSHSELVKQRLRGSWPVDVVPNPVADVFLTPWEAERTGRRLPQVAWLGRLDDHKNWRGFVAAAAALHASGVDAEYVLAGHPVEPRSADDLRSTAGAAGILDRLRWLCALPHRRVPDLLDGVRDSGGAVVLTSRGESFGMTVVEAMARGCAVVVPHCAPYDETTTFGVSSADYRPEDMSSAASVLQRLLGDADERKRLGEAGRAEVLERYGSGPAMGALVEALRRAVSG